MNAALLRIRTPFIRRIEIRNFQNIKELNLDLGGLRQESKPWLVAIGENGVGKSTLLRAVAMTLMSRTQRERLELAPSNFLRQSARKGSVRIFVDGYGEPFNLEFNHRTESFIADDRVLHGLLFCYGSTRLALRKQDSKTPVTKKISHDTDGNFSRVDNLFDPYHPLTNATDWLHSLGDDQFNFSAKAIKQVLGLGNNSILKKTKKGSARGIIIVQDKQKICDSLYGLSDGYKSIIALVTNILEVGLRYYSEVSTFEGIVLIDEVDLHLHPRWKQQILTLLRNVFPRMQFILTTHDPLCLHGARSREIHVLYRDEISRSIKSKQIDIPPGSDADRVLTGAWFEVASTTDLETTQLLDRHRQLLRSLSKTGILTTKQNIEKFDLESQLRLRLGTFADTSLDRMALSIAAEIMTGDLSKSNHEQRSRIREQVRIRLLERIEASKNDRESKES